MLPPLSSPPLLLRAMTFASPLSSLPSSVTAFTLLHPIPLLTAHRLPSQVILLSQQHHHLHHTASSAAAMLAPGRKDASKSLLTATPLLASGLPCMRLPLQDCMTNASRVGFRGYGQWTRWTPSSILSFSTLPHHLSSTSLLHLRALHTTPPPLNENHSHNNTSNFPDDSSHGRHHRTTIHFWTGYLIGASAAILILFVSSTAWFLLLRSGYLDFIGDASFFPLLQERVGFGLFAAGARDGRWSLPVVIGDISEPPGISEDAMARRQDARRRNAEEAESSGNLPTPPPSPLNEDVLSSSSSDEDTSNEQSWSNQEDAQATSYWAWSSGASSAPTEGNSDEDVNASSTTSSDWLGWWTRPSKSNSASTAGQENATASSLSTPDAAATRPPSRAVVGSFIADAVEIVMDSVVNITIETESSTTFRKRSFVSSGSGFFIDEDGTILTNAHVVADSTEDSKLTITTSDGRAYSGTVHSLDVLSDLAVVKIMRDPREPHEAWKPVKFGGSQDMRPGDWVMAIGSPFGLQNTVTAGIVSSRRRKSAEIGGKDSRVEYIQTDCVIHSGSSGGPLINLDGEVVGINTTRAESEGISFAIRVDTSRDMIRQLVEKGRISRPWLGFRMVSLSPQVWQQLRSKGPDEFLPKVQTGVLITSVYPESPAGYAGCEEGITTSEIYQVIGLRFGRPIKLNLLRNVPVEMDWDGRPRGCEAVEIVVTVDVEELDHNAQAAKVQFMSS
ncbi:trypsin-like cysteine/serine peptidase domain-containing protein [Chytridium lagenaria]|nr:trypsin-like cysteine/serine peptidase domain-containing protein [Chytridium lagenaria]